MKKKIRIEGMDIWLPDRSKKKIFGIYKNNSINESLIDILYKQDIEVVG